ncbi:DUF1266 domain-containing protein [Paenibacillus sp. UNC451MF]|uniref:DUF1266 domain-containing protein n=1 Tax=Paenibacillus sp. UNC451MF TaxID=1449063 RepID=UPI00048A57D3|nr:DUF1266 domain-containing protein [Paenibacillus sp. UNC451MF]
MNTSAEEASFTYKPFVDALTAMCIVGRDADYHVQNPNWIYTKRSYLRNLFKHWEIENADTLKENIKHSITIGQRKEFEDISCILSSLSEDGRLKYIESETGDANRKYKLTIVNQYLGRMPSGGIAAVDYTWTVFKCCAGLKMDYLTEEEKWSNIGEVIQIVKSNYSNWKDYLVSFTVGSAFNSINRNSDYISENKAVLTKLFVSHSSPLRQAHLGS